MSNKTHFHDCEPDLIEVSEVSKVLGENEIMSFEDYDTFGRLPLAERLSEVITSFIPMHEKGYVLSLNSRFGTGKTTFIKMWKNYLDEKAMAQTLYLNVWESDFEDEPLIPILSAFIALTPARTDSKVKQAALSAMWSTVNGALAGATGIDISKIVKDTSVATDIQHEGAQIYNAYWYKKKAIRELKEELISYVAQLEMPLVVFVDELDRARPDYAIKFLETIKHIFNVPNICFVLSVDKVQLKNSVEQLYGNIAFDDYYLRFATAEVSLGQPETIQYGEYVARGVERAIKNFERLGVVPAFDQTKAHEISAQLTRTYEFFAMTPRECEKHLVHFMQAMAVKAKEKAHLKSSWADAAMFLLAVKLRSEGLYQRMGQRKVRPLEFLTEIQGITGKPIFSDDSKSYVLMSIAFLIADKEEWNKEVVQGFARVELGKDEVVHLTDEYYSRAFRSCLSWIGEQGFAPRDTLYESVYRKLLGWSEFF